MAESKRKAEAKRTGNQSPKERESRKKDFLVVGLGASAGGVEALQSFFATMPPNTGMAFVVVLHLAPHHESNLAQILQAQTQMPVIQVRETHKVEPDRVYVIPPNQNLEMVDGVVRLVIQDKTLGNRVAIDVFFRTLAETYERNAVCVVLSGTGSDGTLGLKRIKESNGFAVVQAPEDAEYEEMPRSAIATGLVDWVLPIAQMPEKLMGFKESSERMHLTDGNASKVAREINAEESLREILTILRVRTGHDFANYKTPTLVRRIARHLQIHELEDIPTYLNFLRDNPEEIQSLQRNLLINVTNFFRDKEAFEALEKEVVPNLFTGKTSRDMVRVWSAGCASGEEAYSLAMLLHEYAEKLTDPPKLQVFATDVDDEAIAEAREHSYPEAIEADVSEERLKRFFNKEGKRYRIKKELRETVLFAPHNVLRDPPFSKLDLVSCRNLLIYLNRETQERVMEIFHFALTIHGYLFLGSSETAESVPDLFSIVDKKRRIYQRRAAHINQQLAPPQMPITGNWQIRIPDRKEIQTRNKAFSLGEVHYKLLEKFAPPAALVNHDFEVMYMSESVGRYLRFAGGELSSNILKLVHPDLLPELRAALFTAQHEKKSSEFLNLRVKIDGGETRINLIVRAVEVGDFDRDFLLVIFDEVGKSKRLPDLVEDDGDKENSPSRMTDKDDAREAVVKRLEADLNRTRLQLRSTIEQHEVSIEELKAANEELQAINEELRSAGEELETSREELQSVNEELITVNHELKEKMDETGRVNSDLQNLMAATDIATIFLDKNLRIKRYTPPVEDFFNITKVDIERPLEHFTHKLNYDDLRANAEHVLRKLTPIEREITDQKDRHYLARFVPYRTIDDRIEGVVLNFIDISERKKTEAALRRSEEKYRTELEQEVRDRTAELKASKDLLQATMDATLNMIQVFEAVRDRKGEIVDFKYILLNHDAERWMPDALGKSLLEMQPGVVKEGIFDAFKEVVETGVPQEYEKHYVHEQFDGWFHQSVVKLNDGVVTTTATITDRKKAEQELQHSKTLLQDIIDAPNIGIAVYKAVRNKKGEIIDFVHEYINRASVDMLGEDFTGRLFTDHGENGRRQLPQFIEVIETGKGNSYLREADFRGRQVWFAITNTPLDGERLVHTWEDVTDRQNAEAEIIRLKDEVAQQATDKYRTLFDTIDEGFCVQELVFDKRGKVVDIIYRETNAAFEHHIGFAVANGKRASEIFPHIEPHWFETLVRVHQTGVPERTEAYNADTGRWLSAHYSPVGGAGSPFITAVFNDITEHKRRESNLAFLADIAEDFSRLSTADQIMQIVGAKIGDYLKVTTCNFTDVDEAHDQVTVHNGWSDPSVPRTVGTFRMSQYFSQEFLQTSRAGETVVISDTQTDPRTTAAGYAALNMHSFVTVPFHRNGQWTHYIAVCHSEPRNWRDDEIQLIEEISNRIFPRLERARAEESLRESEEKYRTLFDSIDEGYLLSEVVFDENEKPVDILYLDANPAAVRLAGRDFTGRRMRETDPDYEDYWYEVYGRVALTGEPVRAEHYAAPHNRWFDFYVFKIGGQESRRVVCVFQDITTRKRAEEAVRESESRLQLIMQSITDYAVITTDTEGVINGWNTGAEKTFGWTAEEAVGQPNALIFTPEDRAANVPMRELQTALEKGIAEDTRWHVRKDGSRFFASGTVSPIRDGEFEGFVKITSDQTARLEAETALRDKETLQKLVAAQEEERKRIARDLHDELGQQLTALRIKLDAISKSQKEPVLLNQLYEIQNIAQSIDDGVDFLAWELRPTSLDDLGLAAALGNYIKQWSRYSGVKAELTISNLKRARFVPEIETCLYRIVQEALNNTHKHARATSADIILEKRDDLLILIVEDNGKGFDQESKTNCSKGLGLIGMKERAQLAGGTFEIETAPKQGTTIYVRIPFSAAKEK